MAAVPPILLFIASLPPLTSSFVERYLLPAAIASAFFAALVLTVGLRGRRWWQQAGVAVVILAMLVTGLVNMYGYGNYNKNSRTDVQTRQLVQQAAERSEPGVPIVTNTPWVFYEAVFYTSDEHPVYFINETTDYYFGSLDMLEYSDKHKILDLDTFADEHPAFWYIGYEQGELPLLRDSWTVIDRISITSPIDGATVYKGIKIQTN